jgi:hypothetical protein
MRLLYQLLNRMIAAVNPTLVSFVSHINMQVTDMCPWRLSYHDRDEVE